MPRLLVAIFLGLTFPNLAVAKNYCVRWECEAELSRDSSLAGDSTIWGDDSLRSLACGYNLPVVTRPRNTNLRSRRKRVEPERPLQVFLRRWTDDTRDIQEVRAGVHVIQYDYAFLTEKRGAGEIGVRPGYRGWLRVKGLKEGLGEVRTVGYRQYTRKEGSSGESYLTDNLVYIVNREDKTYLTFPPPWSEEAKRQLWQVNSDLKWMFVIPPSFEELQTEFWVSFENAKEGQVRLRLVPLPGKERYHFREIQILIDNNSLRTLAVRIQDFSGGSTVYVFKNKRIVRSPKVAEPIPIPDLKEFKNLDFGQSKREPPVEVSEQQTSESTARNGEDAVILMTGLSYAARLCELVLVAGH